MHLYCHKASSCSDVNLTSIKLDEICDLAGVQVDADRVVDLDEGVGVADGAGVVGHQVRDALGADQDLLHLAQLVLQRRRLGLGNVHQQKKKD